MDIGGAAVVFVLVYTLVRIINCTKLIFRMYKEFFTAIFENYIYFKLSYILLLFLTSHFFFNIRFFRIAIFNSQDFRFQFIVIACYNFFPISYVF